MRVKNRQQLQELFFGGEDISARSWTELLAAMLEKKQDWQRKLAGTLPSPARRMIQRTLQQCAEGEQFVRLELGFEELQTALAESKRRKAELTYSQLKALLATETDEAVQRRYIELQDELDARWDDFVNSVEQRMAAGLTPGKTPLPTPGTPIASVASAANAAPPSALPPSPTPLPGGTPGVPASPAATPPLTPGGIAFIGGGEWRRPGTLLFGRYVLTRIVGRGGMGEVWLAHDTGLEQDIALKFVPEALQYNPKALDDLKKETIRARSLQHPGIVQVFDLVKGEQGAAIAMEYVQGQTLDALQLQQPGRVFEVADLVETITQLCEALEYAHQQKKLVHRDIKPANVMLDAEGQVKLLDFGVARSLCDSLSRISQGKSAGTPYYMSPQQALGEKPTTLDDLYGLGTTIYELVTGKPPFYTGDIMVQVRERVPPPMAERRKELETETGEAIPAVWEEVVLACLAKHPAQRPQSAREVVERLGLTRKGEESRPEPPRPEPDTKPSVRATPRTPAAPPRSKEADSWLTNRLAEKGVRSPAQSEMKPPPTTPVSPPRRRVLSRTLLSAGAIVLGLLLVAFGLWMWGPQSRKTEPPIGTNTESPTIASNATASTIPTPPPSKVSLLVSSVPTGAGVFLNQKPTDATTPASVEVATNQTHEIELVLAGYRATNRSLFVGTQATNLDFGTLTPTPPANVNLQILSDPEGAGVLINNSPSGKTTPTTLEVATNRTYRIELRLDGFLPTNRTIQMGGTAATCNFGSLKREPGRVRITSSPANAEVQINGSPRGKTPLDLDLDTGTSCQVKVVLANYQDAPALPITPQRGVVVTNHWKLIPKDGSLVVNISPPETRISVGNRTVNPGEKITLPSLQAITVTASLEGYDSRSEPITLNPGEPRTLNWLPLSPSTVSVSIDTTPPGASVTLNRQPVPKRTPVTVQAQVNKPHVLVLSLANHQSVTTNFTVPPGKPFDLGTIVLPPIPIATEANKPRTNDVFLLIKSEPSGAEVYLDNGSTPETNPANIRVTTDKPHAVEAKLPGYLSETWIYRPGGVTAHTFYLTPLPVDLTILCNLTNVTIKINAPKVSSSAPYTTNLPPGSYLVSLDAEGYRTLSTNVVLVPGKNTTVRLDFTNVPATSSSRSQRGSPPPPAKQTDKPIQTAQERLESELRLINAKIEQLREMSATDAKALQGLLDDLVRTNKEAFKTNDILAAKKKALDNAILEKRKSATKKPPAAKPVAKPAK